MTVRTMRMKVLDTLAVASQPLYPAEIARLAGIKRASALDVLGRLYREGLAAKAAPRLSADCLWVSALHVDRLPQRNVHIPLLPLKPRIERPESPPPPREPVRIDPRAIACNRSVFDWRP